MCRASEIAESAAIRRLQSAYGTVAAQAVDTRPDGVHDDRQSAAARADLRRRGQRAFRHAEHDPGDALFAGGRRVPVDRRQPPGRRGKERLGDVELPESLRQRAQISGVACRPSVADLYRQRHRGRAERQPAVHEFRNRRTAAGIRRHRADGQQSPATEPGDDRCEQGLCRRRLRPARHRGTARGIGRLGPSRPGWLPERSSVCVHRLGDATAPSDGVGELSGHRMRHADVRLARLHASAERQQHVVLLGPGRELHGHSADPGSLRRRGRQHGMLVEPVAGGTADVRVRPDHA